MKIVFVEQSLALLISCLVHITSAYDTFGVSEHEKCGVVDRQTVHSGSQLLTSERCGSLTKSLM